MADNLVARVYHSSFSLSSLAARHLLAISSYFVFIKLLLKQQLWHPYAILPTPTSLWLTRLSLSIFISVQQISSAATQKLESKNVVFTKDGMRVGVKELKNESYVDKTQDMIVKAWNFSTWPGYKSRLWNKQNPEGLKERKSLVLSPLSSTEVLIYSRSPISFHTSFEQNVDHHVIF